MTEAPLDLDFDLSQTQTAVPLIADGHYAQFRLERVTKVESDKGPSVKLEYSLAAPAPTTDNKTLNPGDFGAKFFEQVQFYDKNTPYVPGNPPPEWAQKKLATRIDALLGTGDAGNDKGKPTRPSSLIAALNQAIGKVLVAKVKVRTGEYPGNEFAAVYFPPDLEARG